MALIGIGAGARAGAQVPPTGQPGPAVPAYRKLRYDEDFSYLSDPARRSDPWDGLKYIVLDSQKAAYLSLGGELRWRYERYAHERWNPAASDENGYLLQRYLLHADLHVGPSLRVFGQLQCGLENGRDGGPRPTDEDRTDVQQLFVDVREPLLGPDGDDVTIRLGRQELLYGSQRLVSVRDSPNVRRTFDAARVLLHTESWRIDAFGARPVEVDPGSFDDSADEGEALWGVYATCPAPLGIGGGVDLYYLGLQRMDAAFAQGVGDEHRHTVGARLFGNHAGFDFDYEGAIQFGSFDGGDIHAWMIATDSGFTFENAATTPRVGLRADAYSGDDDPGAANLQTFNSMYPRGSYFGEMALIGPSNVLDLHPSVAAHLSEQVTLSVDWDIFWRASTEDGVYASNGAILRPAVGDARFIGHQPSVELEWAISRHSTAHLVCSHFFPGAFIDDSGSSAGIDFVGVWLQYRF